MPLVYALQRPDCRESAIVFGNPTGDLHGSETEAKEVAARLGVRPLLRADATRDAVLRRDRTGVLHVASHGRYHAGDPLLSGVELADGRLTADDLIERGPAASLAVFSGCVTGIAERRPGDELIGLARAAALAGIPSVVTTLWRTRDESGAPFFRAFYDAFVHGSPADDALLLAQAELRRNPATLDPVHWAPYVLMGDWR